MRSPPRAGDWRITVYRRGVRPEGDPALRGHARARHLAGDWVGRKLCLQINAALEQLDTRLNGNRVVASPGDGHEADRRGRNGCGDRARVLRRWLTDPASRAPASGRPRCVIVVTGSELVRGERTDLNGPFLARKLLALGLEPTRVMVVGDGADELEAAVREGVAGADLWRAREASGRRTTIARSRWSRGRDRPDAGARCGAEAQIEGVSRTVAERIKRPYADFAAGVRKQATIPVGAIWLGLAGTAPGLLVEVEGTPVVVLPGPPRELQRLWPNALETPFIPPLSWTRASTRRSDACCCFFGASESAGCASARRGRRRRGRGGGDDLRARFRDPREHRGRARGGGARGTRSRNGCSRPARAASVLARRARRRGARARALPRARVDARDGRVVYRRDGRRAAHGRSPARATSSSAASSRTRTRSSGRGWASRPS